MAVTSPGKRCKECFSVSCSISPSISFVFLIKDRIKDQCSDDQVCSYECPNYISDQRWTMDTVEEGGPNGLSEKFSNGTSTIDIDDRHFDDPDSDDKADNHLSKVSTILLVPNLAPNPASIVHPAVESVGDISSFLPALNTAPVSVAIVLPLNPVSTAHPVVEVVGDVSSSPHLVVEVRDYSSSPPPVVEVRDDSPSHPPESSTMFNIRIKEMRFS
ncbi:hypothetical protein Fot_28700 [Forsythia ovata]|uniref:Uncharacterized protein n=1 Tax=Forsythia ovata TaxID=205694 RepID=A0ABD1TPV0_9LAMI